MPANLTNTNISDTYKGVLHFSDALPADGFHRVYDGVGSETGLRLSRTDTKVNDLYARALYTRETEAGVPNMVVKYSQLNSDGNLYLNWRRADDDVSGFLNVIVGDGKATEIARFRGSDKALLVKGDIVAFHTSDKNLKDDIKGIENPLEKISKINGVTFTWNDKQQTHTGSDVGVIAQEVEEIIPEAVTTREDGYKAVKYEKIIPLLIESIKELKNKNEALEAKIATLTQ